MTISEYLAEKATTPKEWLRRDPRTTHPAILEAVRSFEQAGGVYNSIASERIAEAHTVADRHREQLAHEVYVARGILRDEQASERERELLAQGFRPMADAGLKDGGRYLVACGTVYVGRAIAEYGEPRAARARRHGAGWMFLPKGARTRGFIPTHTALVREVV